MPKLTREWVNTHRACREAPLPFSQVTLSTVLTENNLGEIAGGRVVGQQNARTELQVNQTVGNRATRFGPFLPYIQEYARTHARSREGCKMLSAPL